MLPRMIECIKHTLEVIQEYHNLGDYYFYRDSDDANFLYDEINNKLIRIDMLSEAETYIEAIKNNESLESIKSKKRAYLVRFLNMCAYILLGNKNLKYVDIIKNEFKEYGNQVKSYDGIRAAGNYQEMILNIEDINKIAKNKK
jgi:hypothetical protein